MGREMQAVREMEQEPATVEGQGTLESAGIHLAFRPGSMPSDESSGQLLEAWKDIAAYLRRDIRTVQRWEKSLNLPIHRFQNSRSGPVFTYKRELDAWRDKRAAQSDGDQPPVSAPSRVSQPEVPEQGRTGLRTLWAAALIGAAFGAAASALVLLLIKPIM